MVQNCAILISFDFIVPRYAKLREVILDNDTKRSRKFLQTINKLSLRLNRI